MVSSTLQLPLLPGHSCYSLARRLGGPQGHSGHGNNEWKPTTPIQALPVHTQLSYQFSYTTASLFFKVLQILIQGEGDLCCELSYSSSIQRCSSLGILSLVLTSLKIMGKHFHLELETLEGQNVSTSLTSYFLLFGYIGVYLSISTGVHKLPVHL